MSVHVTFFGQNRALDGGQAHFDEPTLKVQLTEIPDQGFLTKLPEVPKCHATSGSRAAS